MKNLIEGLGLIDLSREDVEYVYKFNGSWFNEKGLVSASKSVWTNIVDNRTKYRILGNPGRWHEVPFEFEVDLAAKVLDIYQITTNGVLLKNYKDLGVRKLMISLMDEGVRTTYFISDLMYNAFIDREYDVLAQRTMIPGNFKIRQAHNDITLGEISMKNRHDIKAKSIVRDGEMEGAKVDSLPQSLLMDDYNKLLQDFKKLQVEVKQLKEENKKLKNKTTTVAQKEVETEMEYDFGVQYKTPEDISFRDKLSDKKMEELYKFYKQNFAPYDLTAMSGYLGIEEEEMLRIVKHI